jgi:hypothetical protein
MAGAAPGATLDGVRIVALLTVPCAVALVFALAASHLAGGPTKRPVAAPIQAVVWNNRVFFDREELAKWLRSRGASYETWVKHHPQPTQAAPPVKPASTSRWHLPSRHTVLVGVGAAGLVVVLAVLSLLVPRLARRLRGVELPRLSLPARRYEEPDLTPMGALAYERMPEKPESLRLRRRLDVGFALAASSVGVGLALVLPHL